jgi:hypothetical protein
LKIGVVLGLNDDFEPQSFKAGITGTASLMGHVGVKSRAIVNTCIMQGVEMIGILGMGKTEFSKLSTLS